METKENLDLTGLLPLLFFFNHLRDCIKSGTTPDILWVCNISNLLLAFGMMFRLPRLVQIAVHWLIPGVFIWIFEIYLTGERRMSAFLTHFAGASVGLCGLKQVGCDSFARFPTLLFFFGLQWVSRKITPPRLNVNIAHSVRDEAKPLCKSYFSYWCTTSFLLVLIIHFINRMLIHLFLSQTPRTQNLI